MKIKINGHEIEAEREDIAFIINMLGERYESVAKQVNKLGDSDDSEMSGEFATRVLTRRPLSPSQRKLFKMLLSKGQNWLPTSEIMQKMNLNGNAYGGLFGAIGRRTSTTKGYKEGFTLFQWRWDEEREEHDCRLHPVALEAVRRLDP